MSELSSKAFELQPALLEYMHVRLRPLQPEDIEQLYAVASDPLIWEQHPSRERYKREVFENYFSGAIESGGAFLVMDAQTREVIGCSRYYDYDKEKSSILIGYTFLARSHWGTTHNRALKTVMLNHAFRFVETVIFHIGANNIRSQKAIGKLGAVKMGEAPVAYYGEQSNLNFIYQIDRATWLTNRE
jgi:RimJ/RimL family protein N-acetyltransferase